MKNFFLLQLCFLLLIPALVKAQSIHEKADSLLAAFSRQHLFSGTVIIARKGNVIFEKSYGQANRKENTPNSSSTTFRIGSVSKPFTAMIILQLQEKGLLHISEPLSKYLKDYSKSDSVTIEQLLNHTSGIRSISSLHQFKNERLKMKGREDVLNLLNSQPLIYTPGSKWQYSNSNYMLLAYVAENIRGKTMSELVKEFAAAHELNDTGMDYDGRPEPYKALGYEAGPVEDFVHVTDYNVAIISGAGGMYSTARDLLKLDQLLYSNKIVNEDTKQKMFTAGKGDYGYGWETGKYNGRIEVGHSGSIEGFKSMWLRYPESGTTIIFLSNYWNVPGQEICDKLKAIAFDEAYEFPVFYQYQRISDNDLKLLEGEYNFNGGMKMTLEASSGMILSKLKGQPTVGFKPISATEFHCKANDARLLFKMDENSKVTGFTLIMGKQEMEWKKAE